MTGLLAIVALIGLVALTSKKTPPTTTGHDSGGTPPPAGDDVFADTIKASDVTAQAARGYAAGYKGERELTAWALNELGYPQLNDALFNWALPIVQRYIRSVTP